MNPLTAALAVLVGPYLASDASSLKRPVAQTELDASTTPLPDSPARQEVRRLNAEYDARVKKEQAEWKARQAPAIQARQDRIAALEARLDRLEKMLEELLKRR